MNNLLTKCLSFFKTRPTQCSETDDAILEYVAELEEQNDALLEAFVNQKTVFEDKTCKQNLVIACLLANAGTSVVLASEFIDRVEMSGLVLNYANADGKLTISLIPEPVEEGSEASHE